MMAEHWSSVLRTIEVAAANHLWQSTLLAAVAALAVLSLRGNQAKVRYGVWLAASLQFLLPFSPVSALGSHLPGAVRPAVHRQFYLDVREIGQPVSQAPSATLLPLPSSGAASVRHLTLPYWLPAALAVLWLCGSLTALAAWYLRWRRLSAILRRAALLESGRELNALRRLEQRCGMSQPMQIFLSSASVEPGVFGILRPRLVWPAGISAHLDDRQLDAILAHELIHVRRRDNPAAAVHMVVEAIFWFHPLVWWMGTRLVEERELACDEEVLQMGNPPEAYAESLLHACRFCVESPLACAAGVTGADLKTRVVRIMTQPAARRLRLRGKLLLAAAGLAGLSVPLAFGLMHPAQTAPPAPPTAQASQPAETTPAVKIPEFAVASIKPNKSGSMGVRIMFEEDGFRTTNVPLNLLIREAFGVNDDQISGAPEWTSSAHFDIDAKVDPADVPAMKNLTFKQRRQMIRQLLKDRFGLQTHEETKDEPVYALVVAKGGSKLHPAKPGDTYPNGLKGPDGQHGGANMMMFNQNGQLTAQGVPISSLTRVLSQQLGRTVIDKTGLTGNYDFTLQMPPMHGLGPMPHAAGDTPPGADDGADDSSGPSLFTLVEDQLGLKLESEKAPLPLIVIDHVEQPSQN